MERHDFLEITTAYMQLNQAAVSFLRANWNRCPRAKEMYSKNSEDHGRNEANDL